MMNVRSRDGAAARHPKLTCGLNQSVGRAAGTLRDPVFGGTFGFLVEPSIFSVYFSCNRIKYKFDRRSADRRFFEGR